MKTNILAAPIMAVTAATALVSGCVAPVGPVEVTRFHLPDTSALGRGTIAVTFAPGLDGDSLELRSYQGAVLHELQKLGYGQAPAASAGQVAEMRLRRQSFRPERQRGPVSVGIGGSTGSYGSGVGVGIGLDLSGRPPMQTETELAVTIRDSASKAALWEGRASFTVRADSPMATTQLGAAKLAEALFLGFPGQSGQTIQVK